MREPVHLGDGSYVAIDKYGSVVITANHHDPEEATDRVYLDSDAVPRLLDYLKSEAAPPTLTTLLHLLATMNEEVLKDCYGITRQDTAPLDVAIFAWRDAGCPR